MTVNAVTGPLVRALDLALDSATAPDWLGIRDCWLDALIQAEAFGVEDALDAMGAAIRRRERLRLLTSTAIAIDEVDERLSDSAFKPGAGSERKESLRRLG